MFIGFYVLAIICKLSVLIDYAFIFCMLCFLSTVVVIITAVRMYLCLQKSFCLFNSGSQKSRYVIAKKAKEYWKFSLGFC